MIIKGLRSKKTNKGWVLIYVIVICAVVTLILGNALGGLERKNVYLDYYLKNGLKEDLIQKKKEYLMTEFNGYVEENFEEIREKGVHQYFKAFDITRYLSSIERDGIKFKDGCTISYNTVMELFELNVGTFIFRFYPVLEDNKVQYKFVVIGNEEGI